MQALQLEWRRVRIGVEIWVTFGTNQNLYQWKGWKKAWSVGRCGTTQPSCAGKR